MEILDKNASFLCNSEVYSLLVEVKRQQSVTNKKNNSTSSSKDAANASKIQSDAVDKHLPTIVYESLKYLERTHCISQSPQVIRAFLEECDRRDLKLTKIERLQILNQRPSSAVELQLLIDNSEDRFSFEQMDSMLTFINDFLPASPSASTSDEQQQQD